MIVSEIVYIMFTLNLQNPICILYLQHFSVGTIHVSIPYSHMWLVATDLNSGDRDMANIDFNSFIILNLESLNVQAQILLFCQRIKNIILKYFNI